MGLARLALPFVDAASAAGGVTWYPAIGLAAAAGTAALGLLGAYPPAWKASLADPAETLHCL